ncbi:hypothetical protein ACTXT7_004834 [Hymenolepis weldensis]
MGPPPSSPPPPHDLSEINKQQRGTACCASLSSRELQAPLLDRVITGDETNPQNHLMGQRLTSREEVKMKLVTFSESKLAKFYEEGMR